MSKVIGYDDNIRKQLFTKYKITCEKCGAIILYDKDELKYNYDQREMSTWYECYCPNCKKKMIIYNKLSDYEYFDESEYNFNCTGYK